MLIKVEFDLMMRCPLLETTSIARELVNLTPMIGVEDATGVTVAVYEPLLKGVAVNPKGIHVSLIVRIQIE